MLLVHFSGIYYWLTDFLFEKNALPNTVYCSCFHVMRRTIKKQNCAVHSKVILMQTRALSFTDNSYLTSKEHSMAERDFLYQVYVTSSISYSLLSFSIYLSKPQLTATENPFISKPMTFPIQIKSRILLSHLPDEWHHWVVVRQSATT